jgi:hypothetical protein
MKRNLFNIAVVIALVLSLANFGQGSVAQGLADKSIPNTPTVISYQGYVKVNAIPYHGTGLFKFVIVDAGGTTSYWSNDGSSTGGGEPDTGIVLTVTDGLFSVLLGNSPEAPLTADVFASPDRWLRVWFSSDLGASYTQLSPDRAITTVPYAYVAEVAAEADNAGLLDGLDSLDFALAGHDHDGVYAALGHDHAALYAALSHTHAGLYAPLGHNHDAEYVNDNEGEVGDADIAAGGLSPSSITGTAWTGTNDGSGSLLDADLLDGVQAAAFALAGHDHEGVYATMTHEHDLAYVNDNAGEVDSADITAGGLPPSSITGTAWTAANDGSGSLLDADLLDGVQAAAFALVGHNHDTLYAALAHTHDALYAAIGHNHDAAYVNDNANEVGDQDIAINSLNPNRILGTAWTGTNDGSGSLLDADLLDGVHAAAFALAGHNHDTLYAALAHTHDALYAAIGHNHDAAYVNDNAGEVGDQDIAINSLNPNRILGTAWTGTNDGSGSLLDADLLDGQDAAYYQRRVSGTCAAGSVIQAINADGTVTCLNADAAYVNDNAGEVGDLDILINSINPNRILGTAWTSANDGAGNGLDADLLDGQHAAYYQRAVSGTCAAGSMVSMVNADGTVTCLASEDRPVFARSSLDTTNNPGQYNSTTIGTDGLALISHHYGTGGDLRVTHCSNTACTAATTSTVDSIGFVGLYTSITIGADGLGLISYYDVTNSALKVAHCNNTACTSATTSTLDSPNDVGWYSSITIGADGLGLISYYDNTNLDLKVAHCSDTACSAATISTLDSAGNVGLSTSITIGTDGLGLISYRDNSNGDLKVAHCTNTTCTGATISRLDSVNDVGWDTSITIGSDGLGLISYHDNTTFDLKVAHCGDTACTTASYSTLDSTGVVGMATSITIGSDGLGLISYYDYTNADLKVAHCSNTPCTSATYTSLDTTGDVGSYNSITIGADGLGLISYLDTTNMDLKVVHLSNTLGTNWTRRR